MDADEFLAEYARRFNDGNRQGDLTALADLRTEDATLVWRAPDMPEIRGRLASAGEAIPVGATIAFDDVRTPEPGTIAARLTGSGFPRGDVEGTATFTLDDERITSFTVELAHPLNR